MKTQNQKKLSLEKLQVTRLTNLSFIKGGDGDPVNTDKSFDTDCPQGCSQQQQSNDCPD